MARDSGVLAPEQQLLMTTWHSIGMVLVFTTAVPWLLSHSNCLAVDGRCLRSLPVQQLGTSSTQNCTERTTACRAVPAACPPLEVCLPGELRKELLFVVRVIFSLKRITF